MIPVRRLLIRPGAIGDFVVSLPALECLRAGYTEVWTAGVNVPLVRFADRARSIASTGLDRLGIVEPPQGLMETLRSFDSIVSWYGSNREDFREAVGALPFTFFPALPSERCTAHASDFYLEQARSIAPCESDGIPRLACPQQPPENTAILQPFSGSPRKNWPLAKFRALAARLERTMRVEWCTGPDDPPLPGAIRIDDFTNSPAGWRAHASTSATIPASRIWPPLWASRCWRFSARRTRPCGLRGGRTCA